MATILLLLLTAACSSTVSALPLRASVLADGERAAKYWHKAAGAHAACGWERGVLMAGVMALQKETGDPELRQWARDFAEKFKWGFCPLSGGALNPDNQVCGASYVDLYASTPPAERNATWLAAIEKQYNTEMTGEPRRRHWSWVDTLYMGSSVYGRMAAATGDPRYSDFMLEQIDYAINPNGYAFWSPSDRLWYRDPPGSSTRSNSSSSSSSSGSGSSGSVAGAGPPPANSGPSVFWARGNGWAIGALATALQHSPPSAAAAGDTRRQRIEAVFRSHAARLRELQGADGCWRVSLTNFGYNPTPETTGTAMFTYGIAWGVRAGILPAARYAPVVDAAWRCLSSTSLQASGRVGFCQPGGDRPQLNVNQETTSDFCVGQFLTAAAAVARLAPPNATAPIEA